jgi:SAM-dependent methyltransferase/alkylhydroperoxidase family enzyme
VDFAATCEPSACREYVFLHHILDVGAGDRLLDVACGAGLAMELAALRGARCAGIDASPRLVAIARDRNPDADVRIGDMNALPWDDETFDVVTSFRGIWATTPDAIAESLRVLAAGGRIGLTVWGHIKASPGAWALTPLALAAPAKVQHQATMVSLGRPGAGEALLERVGFTDIERLEIPFAWEFADPEGYARALASNGPAFEAIEEVGESSFLRAAVELAEEQVRAGLPLSAHIAVVGYVATKPARRVAPTARPAETGQSGSSDVSFLGPAAETPAARRLYEGDLAGMGYVMNSSRLWAHLPATLESLSDLMGQVTRAGALTFRQRCVLVTATASTLGDSYCSLAWGKKLADAADPPLAAAVVAGDDSGLDETEQALARWARQVVTDPNAITPADVESLRANGFDEDQIFAITAYVALRLAFSTVNDALGTRPDRELGESTPDPVRSAISFGRPVAGVDGTSAPSNAAKPKR